MQEERMTDVINAAGAERYAWGSGCEGWHLLKRDDLSVIQERAPPGSAEVRHRHARARQFFFVLEGEATLEIDGVAHVLGSRDGVEVPAGAAHQFRNESPRDVVFLVISTPASHGDRVAC
jgi:mannose-6-phosphate isomerase-like protein (cupin superfamily)